MCIHDDHVHAEPEEASVPAPADEVGPFDGEPQPGDPYTYPAPEPIYDAEEISVSPEDSVPPPTEAEVAEARLQALVSTTLDVAESGDWLLLSLAAVQWVAGLGEERYQAALNEEAARRGVDPAGLVIRTAVQFPSGEVFGLAGDGTLYPLGPGDVNVSYEDDQAA